MRQKHNRQDAKVAKMIEFERGTGGAAARAQPGMVGENCEGLPAGYRRR